MVGAPDSAASLAEERVTLRDMSSGSHQGLGVKDKRMQEDVVGGCSARRE